MRIKTLGVFVVVALALFTMFYWLTDQPRRDAAFASTQSDLLAYGQEMFGSPTPEVPATAFCAQCHGADGTGGEVGTTGVMAPNLHSKALFAKLKINPNYVNLVIRFGGVVVSGNVSSDMPAWSNEVGGPLTLQQVDALTALVTSWADEAGAQTATPVPDTVEAGAQVFIDAQCVTCHGAHLEGAVGPNLQNIGNQPVTDLPNPITHLDQLQADYQADPRKMLEQWIRDSAANYNDGTGTGMPPHPVGTLPDDALQAVITFLLSQKGG